jgi:hypothetical protein
MEGALHFLLNPTLGFNYICPLPSDLNLGFLGMDPLVRYSTGTTDQKTCGNATCSPAYDVATLFATTAINNAPCQTRTVALSCTSFIIQQPEQDKATSMIQSFIRSLILGVKKDVTTHPPSVEKAFLDCFDGEARNQALDEKITNAFELLKQHPTLAAVKVELPRLGMILYPLAAFLIIKPDLDLETVKLVYNMYPQALKEQQGRNGKELLLQVSIRIFCPKEICLFFARQWPEAVKIENTTGGLPLFEAVSRRMSLELIKALVELYPESAQERIGEKNKLLVEEMMRYGYGQDALEYAAARISPEVNRFSVYFHNEPFGETEVKFLEKILPQLKELRLQPMIWTLDGFELLLSLLLSNTSIQCLSLSIPYTCYFSNDNNLRRLFQEVLEKHPSVCGLKLIPAKSSPEGRGVYPSFNHILLQDIVSGIQANANDQIEFLDIRKIGIQDSVELATFLTSSIVPRRIELHGMTLQGSWRPWHNWQASPVEAISFSRLRISSASAMLCDLAQLPNLRELDIFLDWGHLKKEDLSEGVATLLATQSIEWLSLRQENTFHISNPVSVLETLGRNKSLKRLHLSWALWALGENERGLLLQVLQEENTTLNRISISIGSTVCEDLSVIFGDTVGTKVEYYLLLNLCGRSQARAENTTLGELVGLLVEAGQSLKNKPLDWFNASYGLLHESRILWANSSD